ncbi:MAG: chromosome segregation protein SMC, partial [Oscillibacter sp.]|nr:chromosome segregation protein SMC [Oscillibacter sp.]
MYLKALEIQGFKSFPDKTVLNFGEDITAIVGPNGSGKSNISDAIRWVMGEQNSRQLRGAKMEDVIFGGTEKRNQMGFAQVTLVIDNTEHIFPTRQETEVAVTRRYYRSGESEYYINKQSVRLKDVNELFMDTGMGREGYSIIGQGKIDEILSVKSGERREVFEEAAGISKYRHRKEDSERKLERTEENLVRINDKIAELELQVEPLRQQAETAKKYLVLRDELRVLEISVWLEQLQDLRTARLKLESDTALAKAECDRAQQALDESYALGESFTEQMRQNDIQAETLRQQAGESDSAAGEESAAIAVLQTSIDHNNDSLRRLEQELTNADARRENLQGQIDAQLAHIADIDSSAAELGRELDALLAQAQALSDSARGAADEAESLRAQEAIAVAEAADGRAALSALNAALESVDQRRTAVRQELTDTQTKLEGSEKEAKQNRRALNDAKEEAQAVQNIIQGHSLRMDSRRQKAEAAQAAKLELTMKVGAQDDRIRLLTEMEKEYEGFNKAVKAVMQAAEKNTLRGIHGPVAGLMTTKQEYAVALETALGGALQNIVVDREEDAKAAIQFLKQRDGGRATFLPLTAIRGDELRLGGVEQEFGFVGLASRLVSYDPRYQNIFHSLLGRTVVVEDLDCGIQMAKRHDNRFRIVTLDGQVINAGGSMTGGSVSRNAGILSRSGELEQLEKKRKKIQSQLQDVALMAESANRELQKAQYELEVAKDQQRQANDRVLTLEGRKNHFDILIESLEHQQESLRIQQEILQKRSTDDAGRMDSIRGTIADFTARAEATRGEMEKLQQEQADCQQSLGEMSSRLTEKKAQQAALSAEGDSARRSMEDLARLRESLEGEHTDRESLCAQMEQAMAQARAQEERQMQEAQELRGRIEEHRQALQKLSQEKMDLEARRSQTDRLSRTCNDTLLNCEREVTRLESKLSGSALEEKQIL